MKLLCVGNERRPGAMAARGLPGLDWLNFFVANFQTGFGPFISVYLTSVGWTQGAIGAALSTGTIASMASQVPAGALVDAVRSHPLAAHGIDQRAGRNLANHTGNCAGAERGSDRALRPSHVRQIDRDKRSKARLKIGDEKVEPVEPRQPACRHDTRSALVADAQQTHRNTITIPGLGRYRLAWKRGAPRGWPADGRDHSA